MDKKLLEKLNKKRAKRNKENPETRNPQVNIGTKQVIQVEEEEYIFRTTEDIIIRNVENEENSSFLFLGTAVIIIAGVLIVSQVLPQIIPSIPLDNQENEKIAKSSQRDKFLEILEGENGKSDGTKYTGGSNVDWCLWYIVWAKNKAGISEKIIPDVGYCGKLVEIFKNDKRWYERGKKTPEVGWIAVFNWGDDSDPYDHAAVVTKVYKEGDTTKIELINGNWSSKVAKTTVDINDSRIIGYCAPDYSKDIALNNSKNQIILDFEKENYKCIVKNKDDEREI